jgi:hypothetical protein
VANINKNIQYSIYLVFLLLGAGCNKGCHSNKLRIDVSGIEVKADYDRFEEDIFACRNETDIRNLCTKYHEFYFIFTQGIMQFNPAHDSLNTTEMLAFVQHPRLRYLYDTTQTVFGDMAPYKSQITEALKHYRFYFKDQPLPKFITYISEFGAPSYYDEQYIGIGLDMYLGADFIYYKAPELEFPQFKINHFTQDFLVRDAVMAFIHSKVPATENNTSVFIDEAVQEGKMLYMLDALCPEMQDSIKIKYSSKQLEWIKNVEKEMWVDLVNRKVLYSKNHFENGKYFNDGPFTSAPNVSQDSPPRVGAWLGWQIVRKYMDTHPNTTLAELIKEPDGQKIFRESGYRPK